MSCKVHSQEIKCRHRGCPYALDIQCRFFSREPHALLGICTSSTEVLHYEAMLTSSKFAYLWDHVVSGMTILPGAAMLEASLAAQHSAVSASNSQDHEYTRRATIVSASILSPLALPSLGSRDNVRFRVEVNTKTGKAAEMSKKGDLDEPFKKHFECYFDRLYASYTLHSHLAANKRSTLINFGIRSKEAYPNSALATIIKEASAHQLGQYHIHPTYLDTCTQAGSALAYMPAEKSSHVTRVPVGVHACQFQSRLCNSHAWACASIVGLLPDDSALGDFNLANCDNLKRSLNILGMIFKTKRNNNDFLRSNGLHHGFYEQIWSVLQPQRLIQIRLPQAKSMAWEIWDSSSMLQERFVTHSHTSLLVATSLRLLQSENLGPQVCLVDTSYCTPIAQQASPTRAKFAASMQGAAAAGLIRVAHRELYSIRWIHIMQSLYAPYKASFDPAMQLASDLSFHSREGLWQVPNLCASFEANKNHKHDTHASMVCNHTTIITGGLGGIGSLVGAWCTGGGVHAPIILLSRSSHSKASRPVEGMKESHGLVCFAKCDVAMKDDVAALLRSHAYGHKATKLVMHAGGVTADKPIKTQVCPLFELNMESGEAPLIS